MVNERSEQKADAPQTTGQNENRPTLANNDRTALDLLKGINSGTKELPTAFGTSPEIVGNTTDSTNAQDKVDVSKLRGDGSEVRDAIREGIQRAKTGQKVEFNVDATVSHTDANGKTMSQAEILYSELQRAYPDRHFVFAKPDLKPGDQGYTEIPTPLVHKDGLALSTSENPMTLAREVTLADGTKLPAGSTFAVGTVRDGNQFTSLDPDGRVWATTPDGKQVAVSQPGQAASIPADAIDPSEKRSGQVLSMKTEDGGQNHFIVREGKGKTPDGRPVLDAYATGGANFEEAFKPGEKPGYSAAKPKLADHFKLPENVTVQSNTAWGHGEAAGTKNDYFMKSGFGDAQAATAKNYTGETDPRSARELMRIRQVEGISGPTQVEAGLRRAENTITVDELRPRQPVVEDLKVGNTTIPGKDLAEMHRLAQEQTRHSNPNEQLAGRETLAQIEQARKGNRHAQQMLVGKWRGMFGAGVGALGLLTGLLADRANANTFEQLRVRTGR